MINIFASTNNQSKEGFLIWYGKCRGGHACIHNVATPIQTLNNMKQYANCNIVNMHLTKNNMSIFYFISLI